MNVLAAPFPALGFDTIATITDDSAAALKAAGMSFGIRYLGGVSANEVQSILNAGLYFMPVTYSRAPGWVPTATMGQQDGAIDVGHLRTLGLPKACTVWIDLEGVAPSTSASAVEAWVNARSAAIVAAGWEAGLYIGDSPVLNSAQLYSLPNINRYWKAWNLGIPEPRCGFCMMQLNKTITLASVEVDIDCIQYDYEGRLPSVIGA
jgi:hypothetical protein